MIHASRYSLTNSLEINFSLCFQSILKNSVGEPLALSEEISPMGNFR